MTRRYKPTAIQVGHEATQRAERWREQARPDPAPEVTPAPAAWEAKPEPKPAKLPPHGKPPKNVVVRMPVPEDMMLLSTEEVDILLGMADETFSRENTGPKKTDPLPRVRRDAKLTARRRSHEY